jgi:hypothetical protein
MAVEQHQFVTGSGDSLTHTQQQNGVVFNERSQHLQQALQRNNTTGKWKVATHKHSVES